MYGRRAAYVLSGQAGAYAYRCCVSQRPQAKYIPVRNALNFPEVEKSKSTVVSMYLYMYLVLYE